MRIKPTRSRRNVVLDIETVSLDPNDPKGALSAAAGRIVCISLLVDDGETIIEKSLIDHDEKAVLAAFWQEVRPTDLLIGFNLMEFDLMFIRQRSWVHGVRPTRRIDLKRYYSRDVLDLMHVWSNWGFQKQIGLDALAKALGLGGKTANGVEVFDWWKANQVDAIAEYCLSDVRLTFRVFCRLMFLPLPSRFCPFQLPPELQSSIPSDVNVS